MVRRNILYESQVTLFLFCFFTLASDLILFSFFHKKKKERAREKQLTDQFYFFIFTQQIKYGRFSKEAIQFSLAYTCLGIPLSYRVHKLSFCQLTSEIPPSGSWTRQWLLGFENKCTMSWGFTSQLMTCHSSYRAQDEAEEA